MNERVLVASAMLMLASLGTIDASDAGVGSGPGLSHAAAKIEGHWTLTVREENGAVASVHTFYNHFEGHFPLRSLLMGQRKTRGWALALDILGDSGGLVTCLGPDGETSCSLRQIEYGSSEGVPTLRVEGGTIIQLSGTLQPAGAGILDTVRSGLEICSDTSTCVSFTITRRRFNQPSTPGGPIPEPILVKARQHIDVTLRITAR